MLESPGGSALDLTGTIGSSDIRALEDFTLSTESSAVSPGAHKRNPSPVHQHFVLNNETQKMKCKHCR